MTPIVDGLEEEYGDRVAFQRMNVDQADGRAAAETYRVLGHPAIVILDAGGNVVFSRVGVQPRDDLAAALAKLLANAGQ
jgi:thioredoxin-like negative regulator of GroEL